MCKKFAFIVCIVMLCVQFIASAAPFTWIDDFTRTDETGVASYQGLTVRQTFTKPPLSYGTFASNTTPERGYTASAVYNISGVSRMKLGLYTSVGSFAQQDPVVGLSLGVGTVRDSSMLINAPQAKIGVSQDKTRGIYTFADNRCYRLFWDSSVGYYCFYPVDDTPGSLINYGVNVYADGKLLTLTRTNIGRLAEVNKCYEEFEAAIPANTKSIRVEINDIAVFPEYNKNGQIHNDVMNLAGLAYVEFAGEYIKPEEPVQKEELLIQPPTVAESSTPEARSTARTTTRTPSVAVVPEVVASKPESKSSATSSSSKPVSQSSAPTTATAKTPSTTSQSKFEGSAPYPVSSQSSSKDELPKPEESVITQPTTYYVEKPPRENNAGINAAVIYIVLASAALVMVLLRSSK